MHLNIYAVDIVSRLFKLKYQTNSHLAGPHSAVINVSDSRYVSDCRSRGHKFGPDPYFCVDWSWNNFYGHSPPFSWFKKGCWATSESVCMNYWSITSSRLPRKESVVRWTVHPDMTVAVDWDYRSKPNQTRRLTLVYFLIHFWVHQFGIRSVGYFICATSWDHDTYSSICMIELFISWCHLLITFANSLDPDQAQENVGHDLDPNYLTLCWYSWKNFWKLILKEISRQQKSMKNFLGAKSLMCMCMFSSEVRCLVFVLYLHPLKGDSSTESKEV